MNNVAAAVTGNIQTKYKSGKFTQEKAWPGIFCRALLNAPSRITPSKTSPEQKRNQSSHWDPGVTFFHPYLTKFTGSKTYLAQSVLRLR